MAFIPPCTAGKCEQFGDTTLPEHHQILCKEIGQIIIDLGGGGIFETTPCPHAALIKFGTESDDPVMQDIRTRLGITTVYIDPDLL